MQQLKSNTKTGIFFNEIKIEYLRILLFKTCALTAILQIQFCALLHQSYEKHSRSLASSIVATRSATTKHKSFQVRLAANLKVSFNLHFAYIHFI